MTRDKLEFLVSQYVDGALSASESAAVETRLRDDPEARALLADFRRVDALVSAARAPELDWNVLAGRINEAIDAEEAADAERRAAPYRLPVGRWAASAALVAACLLVGLLVWRGGVEPAVPGATRGGVELARVVQVAGPSAEATTGPRVLEVAIGLPAPAGEVGPGGTGSGSTIAPVIVSSLVWSDLGASGSRIVVTAGEPPPAPDALSGY